MDAFRSRSCTIVLRFDSSGRLDLVRSCVKPNCGSTIDSRSLTNLSPNTVDLSASSKTSSPTFTPEIGPGRFLRLCRGGTGYTGEGYADGGEPSAEYLQAQLAIESIWLDLEKYIKQVATAVNLPFTALELQYDDAASRASRWSSSPPPCSPGHASGGRSTSSPSWPWPARS